MDVLFENKNHAETLQKALYELYQDSQLCDTVLTTSDGAEFHVHAVVLAGQSDYLKEALGKNENRLEVKDISAEDQVILLEYLYTGKLRTSVENISRIHNAALKLSIKEAEQLCRQFIDSLQPSPVKEEDRSHQRVKALDIKEENEESTEILSSTDQVSEQPDDSILETFYCQKERTPDKTFQANSLRRSSRRSRSRYRNNDIDSEAVDDNEKDFDYKNDTECSDTDDPDYETPLQKKVKMRGTMKTRREISKPKSNRRQSRSQPCKTKTKNKQRKVDDTFSLNKNTPRRTSTRRHAKVVGVDLYSEQIKIEIPNVSSDTLNLHFKCDQCRRQFGNSVFLEYHRRLSHSRRSFGFRNYSVDAKLNRSTRCTQRVNLKLNEQDGFPCSLCDKKFSLMTRLQKHFIESHYRKYKCIKCSKAFLSRRILNLHRCKCCAITKTRETKRPSLPALPKSCKMCSRQFLHASNLRQHVKSCHKKTLHCHFCGKIYKSQKCYYDHIEKHDQGMVSDKKKPNKDEAEQYCHICHHPFRDINSIKKHFVKAHQLKEEDFLTAEGIIVFRCDVQGCDGSFPNFAGLKSHAVADHPNVVYTCKVCDRYKTHLNVLLQRHMKQTHKSTAPTCDICGKVFRKKSSVKLHKFSKHKVRDPTIKVFECTFEGCEYSCTQRSNLKVHELKHIHDKPFECSMCSKKLKTEKNLQKHMNKIHLGIRPFICEICGNSYGEESELKIHIVRHSEDKAFTCKDCNYSTCDKGNFQSHMFAIHRQTLHDNQKIYQCTECDYMCDRKTRFTQHMKSHKNIRDFVCNQCGKSFVSSSTLQGHIKWIHSEKNFHCDYCDHATVNVHHLREHIRTQHTHRHVKPYKCLYCDYRCTISGNCRKHVMNKHKGRKVGWVKVCEKYPELAQAKQSADQNKEQVNDAQLEVCLDNVQLIAIDNPEIVVTTETDMVAPSTDNQLQTAIDVSDDSQYFYSLKSDNLTTISYDDLNS